jgi:hypothetical protein
MCDRITTSAWTDGTLSKKFHHRTPFGETAFCTQDMFAAALRLRTGSRGRVHGDCAQPKTVGKRLLPQLGCVGKMALAWRTRGKNRGKTTSTFSHDSRALEYVFANQVQIVTVVGNGARTRDLNFGKYMTTICDGPSAFTPSGFGRESSRSVRRYPCFSVVKIVVKTTYYHEKKLRFAGFYHGFPGTGSSTEPNISLYIAVWSENTCGRFESPLPQTLCT